MNTCHSIKPSSYILNFDTKPASREERNECGVIIENLALSAGTPCSLYAIYLPSGSIMRSALGGCMYTFFATVMAVSRSILTLKTARLLFFVSNSSMETQEK